MEGLRGRYMRQDCEHRPIKSRKARASRKIRARERGRERKRSPAGFFARIKGANKVQERREENGGREGGKVKAECAHAREEN